MGRGIKREKRNRKNQTARTGTNIYFFSADSQGDAGFPVGPGRKNGARFH